MSVSNDNELGPGISHTSKTLSTLRKVSDFLLIGLTGGIASGKSTVARMFEDMGAIIIDFDILARDVVRPDEPAWQDIVDYFGSGILREDKSIDRKILSAFVFSNREKRKKLESFIHPHIDEAFADLIKEIATGSPKAVIIAVVPLLIEANMKELFDKLIIVHIPSEEQIKRLIKRDGISRESAENILKSQMSIDDKIKYGDFIISNNGSVEETEKQVKKVWEEKINLP